jgi:RNA polymerase sigma-70 factor (ECF subfamily)
MHGRSAHEITLLISRWQRGDREAEHSLFESLYQTLRAIAANCLIADKQAQSLSPTVLVHEAYLRLMKSRDLQIGDRTHFLALVSRVMRRIIVDRARAAQSQKRGTDPTRVELLEGMAMTDRNIDEILAVNAALDELSIRRPREAALVELRYFAGFSLEEAASALKISPRTARRDWEIARLYIKDAINGTAPTGESHRS